MDAVDLIKRFEGLRLKAYQDQAGVWTVGYGATGPNIGPHTIWTQAQADADLIHRVAVLRQQVDKLIHVHATENQENALLSLAYNIGIGGLASSSAIRDLNGGNIQAAADDFLKWKFITVNGQKVENAGLLKRRQQERALFLTA
jgi:lysozyme